MLQTAFVSLLISVSQLCPTPPVISLNGYATVYVNCNDPYVELGGTAWSVCDGDLTNRIVINNSQVNTSVPGEYYVTYNVTDQGGQSALELVRRVIVEDDFTLTVNGFNYIMDGGAGESIYVTFWDCNRPYDDFGAMAWDNCDGDLTQSIIVEGADDILPRELGDDFWVTYTVTNSRGETLTAQRYVIIEDFYEPTVSLSGTGQSVAEVLPPDDPDPKWWLASAVPLYDNTYPEGDPWRLFDLPSYWRIRDYDNGVNEDYAPHWWFCDRPAYEDPGAQAFDECEGPLDPGTILAVLIRWYDPPGEWGCVWTGFLGDVDRNPPPPLANNRYYRMFYLSVDSSGNAPWGWSWFRSVRSRQIRPVYAVSLQTISGPPIDADVQLPCGTIFDPASNVIALSTCEGDITSRITITSSGVDFTKPLPIGSYRIRYDASDNYGWVGWAQRNINVIDGGRPVITLLDEAGSPTTAKTVIPWCALRDKGPEWWKEYPDEDESNWYVLRPGDGWKVADNCASDDVLTNLVQLYGQQALRDALEMLPAVREQSTVGEGEGFPIDPATYLREYRLSHNVNDGSGESTGQAFPAYRIVEVVPTVPKVELKIDANTTVECGSELGVLRDLVTVTDEPAVAGVEGCGIDDIDPAFLTISGFVDTDVPGKYTVTYDAINALGISLEAPVVLTVNVKDTKPPVVSLIEKPGVVIDPSLEWEVGVPFNWATQVTVTATDICSGNVAVALTSDGGMNFNAPQQGLYRLVFSAVDEAGNVGKATLTVSVEAEYVDRYPEIALLGESLIALECHSVFTDPGAVATDEEQGDLTASIRKGGFVNTAVPGSYVLTYTVTNNLNNSASVSRIVTIEDTVAPILTLRPPTAMTVSLNERFIDPGASADDNCDGNVPVTVVGAVNTAKAGVYLLTYIATDSTGNDAFPLTRRVTVLGTMGGEGELREGEGGEGEGDEGEGEGMEGEIDCCDDGCCGCAPCNLWPKIKERLLGDYLIVGLGMMSMLAFKRLR